MTPKPNLSHLLAASSAVAVIYALTYGIEAAGYLLFGNCLILTVAILYARHIERGETA